ncbi:MAG: YigZ family protein [Gemmatimonadaceae bacterium]|nr:YigZ family protein [Gemmatimonadaceae bacterium]
MRSPSRRVHQVVARRVPDRVRRRAVGRVDRVVTERVPATPRYPIPAGRHRTELVIDRSRFVCTVTPTATVDEAQAFIREVQREFSDASHNCWAYVIGAPGSSDRIGLSDDGEPHGTAGRPMFTVLQHSGLGDIAAVVTRYFGGVKLGTGGLVKAYSAAVQQALESVPRVMRVTRVDVIVRVGYPAISAVQQLFPAFEVDVVEEAFGVDVMFHLRCPEEQAAGLRQAVMDVTRGQGEVETGDGRRKTGDVQPDA